MGGISESHFVLLGSDRTEPRDRLHELIGRAGYRARTLGTARAVMSELQGGGYFAVIVDGELPELDIAGIRAAGRAGGLDPYVVLVGGEMDAESVRRGHAAGPDDHLLRPEDPDEVALRLGVAARAAERALEGGSGHERFRAAADGSSDAVYVVEPTPDGSDLTIVHANERAEEVFGAPESELVGRTLTQILPGQAGLDEVAWIESVMRGGYRGTREVTRMLPGPIRRHLYETVTPVLRGAVVTARDLTERRLGAAEEAARRRVATAVASARDPRQVFAQAAQEAASLLDADAGAVFRREGASLLTVGVWAAEPTKPRELGSRIPLSSEAAAARAVLRLRPARNDATAETAGSDEASGARSFMRNAVAAPIWVGEEVWGALAVAASSLGRFPPGSEYRLAHFADLVGLSIVNAEDRAALVAEARTDPLTRVANQRVFHERLSAELARAARSGAEMSLILVDLDHFKLVNDRWGHAIGDSVIVEVAWLISDHAREADTVARVGGDEFGWILPDASAEAAIRAAERLRDATASQRFSGAGALTVSLGVAERGPDMDAAELFRRADAALYHAKLAGRDKVVGFSGQADVPPGGGAVEPRPPGRSST